ncbi:hypothetical protein L1887_53519 [Cichorium endivia]|nr:hypothetical protein L1887_53519 [Cichorium endivia]
MLARAEVSPDVRCVYAALSILGAVFEAMPRGLRRKAKTKQGAIHGGPIERVCSSNEHHGLTDVARRSADEHLELAVGLQPLLLIVAPRRDIVLAQVELDLLGIVLADLLAAESTKHLGRLARAPGELEVRLPHLVAVPVAGIGERERHLVLGLEEPLGQTRRGVRRAPPGVVGRSDLLRPCARVGKLGVRQTEAKLVPRLDVFGVKVAVVDVERLGVVDLRRDRVVVVQHISAVVGAVLADRVRQPTAGVVVAVQHIHKRAAALAARKVGPDDRRHVGILGEALHVDGAGRVHNDDRVVVDRRDVADELLALVPEREVVAIALVAVHGDVALTALSADEDERDVGHVGNHDALCQVEVVEVPRDAGAVLARARLQRLVGREEVRVVGRSRAPPLTEGAVRQTAVLRAVGPVVGSLVQRAGVGANHSHAAWLVERKSIAAVLEQHGTCAGDLAGDLVVVGRSVNMLVGGRVLLVEEVEVGLRVSLVLAEQEPTGKNARGHVVQTRGCDRTVVDSSSKVAAPERAFLKTAAEHVTRHGHVETGVGRSDTGVLGTPVGHDVAGELQLGLETVVEQLRVLAGPRVVDEVVRAHDRSCTRLDTAEERMQVDLALSARVEVGAALVSEVLLLIVDVVLECGLHAGILCAKDRVVGALAVQVRVSTEAFPVTATKGGTCDVHHGSQPDVGTLGLELFTESMRTLVEEVAIEGCGGGDGIGERGDTVGASHASGAVHEAKTGEADTRNGRDVADARSTLHPEPVVRMTFSVWLNCWRWREGERVVSVERHAGDGLVARAVLTSASNTLLSALEELGGGVDVAFSEQLLVVGLRRKDGEARACASQHGQRQDCEELHLGGILRREWSMGEKDSFLQESGGLKGSSSSTDRFRQWESETKGSSVGSESEDRRQRGWGGSEGRRRKFDHAVLFDEKQSKRDDKNVTAGGGYGWLSMRDGCVRGVCRSVSDVVGGRVAIRGA